jgi:hypothetical protein
MKTKQTVASPLAQGKVKRIKVVKQNNDFPAKIEGPQLNASGNEVAIETVEIAHESLKVEND